VRKFTGLFPPATAGITSRGRACHSCCHCRIRRYPVVVSGPPSGAIVPSDRGTIRAGSGSHRIGRGRPGLGGALAARYRRVGEQDIGPIRPTTCVVTATPMVPIWAHTGPG